jgi:hypothetical protein
MQTHIFLNPARWLVRAKAQVPDFDRVDRVNFYFNKNSKRHRFRKKINELQQGF